MTLDQIVGQVVPVSILKRALNTGTLGHAYLFSGEEGLGKETVARAVAHELRKQGGPISELHVLGGEGSIGVGEIRSLRNKASLSKSGNSIWIILNVERLTPEASNAFLKILEEPPVGTYFFLTTTIVHKLLPTIISRCQHLPFRRVAEQDICLWLADRTRQSPEDAQIRSVARLAQGSPGKALALLEGALLQERDAVIAKLMEVPRASYPEVLGLSQNWPEDRNRVDRELQLFLEWHRDLLMVKNGINLPLYNPGYERELAEISELYTNKGLLMIIENILEMRQAIAGNGRIRFCLGYVLLMMKRGALT
ncbi:MAG: AAA family ATPase [Firmicutes bacterium]|nr:AAA family ATPase [Bacillota bacterium]